MSTEILKVIVTNKTQGTSLPPFEFSVNELNMIFSFWTNQMYRNPHMPLPMEVAMEAEYPDFQIPSVNPGDEIEFTLSGGASISAGYVCLELKDIGLPQIDRPSNWEDWSALVKIDSINACAAPNGSLFIKAEEDNQTISFEMTPRLLGDTLLSYEILLSFKINGQVFYGLIDPVAKVEEPPVTIGR